MDKSTQKYISSSELILMEKQDRVNLVNSLGGFKSICLIGTKSNTGHTNLAIFSSIFHIGANPALIAIIVIFGQLFF
jgi:flavin reductase (DIM6/NTAB) family NADH-FMN oxidoreductase RutF